MNFKTELTEFPSAVHSAIYAIGRGIMPLSLTLNSVSDTALRESCIALHGFISEMLSDMYDNPEAYHLPVGKLEEFLNGKSIHDMKREHFSKIKKLDTQVRHSAIIYIDFLSRIAQGAKGKVEDDSLVISAEDFQYVSKRVNSSASPISLVKRMEVLNRIGFIMEELPTGEYRFISKNYPKMFPALIALPWDNLSMVDFRNIGVKYTPTHDDYFLPLITAQREQAYDLHNFAMEYKMRVSINANWGVVYHYKSKHVMTISTGCDFNRTDSNVHRRLLVSVIGKDKKDSQEAIESYLLKESKAFQQQALQRMSGCDSNHCLMCSSYSSGNYVQILGNKHQMCGEGVINFDWHIPEESEMAIIKRLIEINRKTLDLPITFMGKKKYVSIKGQFPNGETIGVDEPGEVWRIFNEIEEKIPALPESRKIGVAYPDTAPEGCFTYFVGKEVESSYVDDNFQTWILPAADYLVCRFEAENFEELVTAALNKAFNYIGIWQNKKGLKREGFGAEIYYSSTENEIGFAYMEIWALWIEGR